MFPFDYLVRRDETLPSLTLVASLETAADFREIFDNRTFTIVADRNLPEEELVMSPDMYDRVAHLWERVQLSN